MNSWLQTRQYTCQRCGARYLHDRAHHHASYVCPASRMLGLLAPAHALDQNIGES